MKLNNTMRNISDKIKSTKYYWQLVLSHIPPANLGSSMLLSKIRKISENPQLPINADSAARVLCDEHLNLNESWKWGKIPSPECDCGATRQTISHKTQECSTIAYLGSPRDFLMETNAAINYLILN